MKTRPEITDEEIRSYMDFDRLLEIHKNSPSGGFRGARYAIAVALMVGAGLSYWFLVRTNSDETKPANETKSEETFKTPSAAVDDSMVKKNNAQQSASGSSGTVKKEDTKQTSTPALKPEKAQSNTNDSDKNEKALTPAITPPAEPVYAQAEPVDGYPNLYEYFRRELKYPAEAMKDSIQGEVTAIFTINADGNPERITIENSLGPAFDREAVRLITNMPEWKAATYNNKPVASRMSLPLTFQIKKITSEK